MEENAELTVCRVRIHCWLGLAGVLACLEFRRALTTQPVNLLRFRSDVFNAKYERGRRRNRNRSKERKKERKPERSNHNNNLDGNCLPSGNPFVSSGRFSYPFSSSFWRKRRRIKHIFVFRFWWQLLRTYSTYVYCRRTYIPYVELVQLSCGSLTQSVGQLVSQALNVLLETEGGNIKKNHWGYFCLELSTKMLNLPNKEERIQAEILLDSLIWSDLNTKGHLDSIDTKSHFFSQSELKLESITCPRLLACLEEVNPLTFSPHDRFVLAYRVRLA